MPTYDYRCKACAHEFELFQSMSAKPERKCPVCGKKTLERLIGTGAALLFKGSGFYQTDYRSESYKKSADADKPASTSGEVKSSDSKSDGKGSAEKTATTKEAASKPAPAESNSGKNSKPEGKAASSGSKSEGKSENKSGGKSSKKS